LQENYTPSGCTSWCKSQADKNACRSKNSVAKGACNAGQRPVPKPPVIPDHRRASTRERTQLRLCSRGFAPAPVGPALNDRKSACRYDRKIRPREAASKNMDRTISPACHLKQPQSPSYLPFCIYYRVYFPAADQLASASRAAW